MASVYGYTHLRIRPRTWPLLIASARERVRPALESAGGLLCGLFLPQIGLAADEGRMLVGWPDRAALERAGGVGIDALEGVREHRTERLVPTVRPERLEPALAGGVYAHRRFRLRTRDWAEFQALSEQAWPSFEKRYEARVFGLFRSLDEGPDEEHALLLTRYASLAVWEASRMEGERDAEQEQVRARFLRRHELTEHTVVVSTRLAPV